MNEFEKSSKDILVELEQLRNENENLKTMVEECRLSEDNLHKSKDFLEEKIRERTIDLVEANEKLRWEIQERNRQEAARRESEENYKNLLNNIPDIIYTIGRDGKVSHINFPAADFYGYKKEDVINQDFSKFIHEEDREKIVNSFLNAITEKKEYAKGLEFRVIAKDRSTYWIDLNSHMRFDEHGEFIQEEGILRDITARKEAEDALKNSENLYRELVENANSIILRFDKQGRVRFINQFAQDYFGFSENEIIGEHLLGTIVPEREYSGRDLNLMINDIIQHPERYKSNENENMKKNGERVWVAWTNRPIFNEKGECVEILSVGNDVTERKQAEDVLRESEEKYRLVTENALESIFILQDDKFVYINPRCEELIGCDALELYETPFLNFVHMDDRDHLVDVVFRNFESQTPTGKTEFRILTKDRDERSVILRAVNIMWKGRRALLCFMSDVTIEKKLEDQIRKAQKMEVVGTMAAGIAHDFNNTLQNIMINTEVALFGADEPELIKDALDQVIKACTGAEELVRQILTLSRAREGEVQSFKMGYVVKEALKMLRTTLPSSIEIKSDIETKLSTVYADPTQIHQVIMNLCLNASDAMKENGGLLEVSLKQVDVQKELYTETGNLNAGDYLLLKIRDTGKGIDARLINRIFDPFFTTKARGEASGMGLAVVLGIIKKIGGGILVESKPGSGTIFDVYLPQEKKEAQ